MSIGRGYIVPEPIDPEAVVCLRVYVPADQLYVAAFMRSYRFFGQWLAWERDETHKASQAAAVWRDAIDRTETEFDCAGGECGLMDVRQGSTPCLLEKQVDCDGSWEQFADMRLCVPKMRMVNGVIQQDTTGNGDWVDAGDPDLPFDDRKDGPFTPAWTTPPEGESGACLAALNSMEWVRARVQQICYANRDYYDYLIWFSVLVAALALLAGVGLIIVVLSGALITLIAEFAGGPEDWGDAGDYDWRGALKCAFNGAYSSDGTMTTEGWQGLQDDIAAEAALHTGAEKVAINLAQLMVMAVGPVGMSRAANFAGIVTGECDCGWYRMIDFTEGAKGFARVEGYTLGSASGSGWAGTLDVQGSGEQRRGILITRTWSPSFTVTKIKITYSLTKGSYEGNQAYCLYSDDGSTAFWNISSDDLATGDNQTKQWNGTRSIATLRLQSLSGYSTSVDPGGEITIHKAELWGTGTPPEI